MIVNAGIALILNRLAHGLFAAVGTGTNAPSPSDTELQAEVARVAVGTYRISHAATLTLETYFTSGQVGGVTLHEVGIFDAPVGGNLLCRSSVTIAVPTGRGVVATIVVRAVPGYCTCEA